MVENFTCAPFGSGPNGRGYRYGEDSRLRRVTVNGTETARYHYNGKGEQVAKTDAKTGETQRYLYDEAGQCQ
ncbi:hypothetical protein EBB59_13300, partial [Lysobacter pythonis]